MTQPPLHFSIVALSICVFVCVFFAFASARGVAAGRFSAAAGRRKTAAGVFREHSWIILSRPSSPSSSFSPSIFEDLRPSSISSWPIFNRQQTTRGIGFTEHAEAARGEVDTRMRCVHAHCPICARHIRARAHGPIDNRPSDFAHRPVRIPRCDAAQHATQLRDIDLRFDRRLPWSVSPRSHSHVVDCVFGVVSTTHSIDCRRLTFLTDLHPQCVNLPICVDGVEGLAMCGQHYPHAHHLRVALVGVVQPDFVHLVRHFFQLNLATYVARQEDLPPCLRQVIIHVHVFLRFVW